MFGLGAPEFAVMFGILIVIYVISNRSKISTYGGAFRKCLQCNYEGNMKTWLSNYSTPQFIVIILLLFWVIPGLIFIAWGWGKHKCPQCNALGKNIAIGNQSSATENSTTDKICPYCAETIKSAAIVCKHCNRDLTAEVV